MSDEQFETKPTRRRKAFCKRRDIALEMAVSRLRELAQKEEFAGTELEDDLQVVLQEMVDEVGALATHVRPSSVTYRTVECYQITLVVKSADTVLDGSEDEGYEDYDADVAIFVIFISKVLWKETLGTSVREVNKQIPSLKIGDPS